MVFVVNKALNFSSKTKHSHNSKYLEYTLVSGMLLQFNQTIKNNQLHIVVALLDNQINVALGSSLETIKECIRDCTRPKTSLLLGQI